VERFVKAKVLSQCFQGLFGGSLPEEKFCWVTGGYVHHEKNDDGYP
jgi:hypothetical protein